MFSLHVKIELPEQSWGEPVRQATDTLLAAWPQAQTRVYGGSRRCDLIVDLKTMVLPDALAAIQRMGQTLNPQGLTLIEVAGYDEAAPEIGFHASGPAQAVGRWLTEATTLDRNLNFNGRLVAHLRYPDEPEAVA